MTPSTVPTIAVPTDNTPAEVSVIPVGKLAPDGSTPNFPPRAIPAGKVFARSNIAPLPTTKAGAGLMIHAPGVGGGVGVGDGEGDGVGVGEGAGDGDGDGLGDGEDDGGGDGVGVCRAVDSLNASSPPQPTSNVALAKRLPCKNCLRLVIPCLPAAARLVGGALLEMLAARIERRSGLGHQLTQTH
jgi:hypothetical protein